MRVFRWLMVIPGALVVGMVASLAGGIVLSIFGNQSLTDAGSAFFGPFAAAFAGGLIAPTKRTKTTVVLASVIVFLALLSFVLSVATNLEGFADRPPLDKVLVPVSQILGVLYAVFLLPPTVTRGATLEQLWKEVIALGVTVVLLGVVISAAGVLVGLFAETWTGLTTGLGVFVLGAVTWSFPFFHLSFRARRIRRAMDELLTRDTNVKKDTALLRPEHPNQEIDPDSD